MSAEAQKQAVAAAAAERVEAGWIVGLGSGTTAEFFIEALARRALEIRCVATSTRAEQLGSSLGLHVEDLDAVERLDLTVDGADEIGPGLSLIKGGGAALLREKLVWQASQRCLVIADASKVSAQLGRFALPIEVVAFGRESTRRRIDGVLAAEGVAARAKLRVRDGRPVATDSGNVLYDVACGAIPDPASLGAALKALTGVVDHGLFLGLADEALIADATGVRALFR